MNALLRHGTVATLLLGSALATAADAQEPQWFDLRGFGSLVATRTSDARVGWRVQNQPIGQARAKAGDWALNAESLVGLQGNLFSDRELSATVQAIAINREEGRIAPEIELAFLRWRLAPEWQARFGRIWTPSFMNSETRYVGYANTTVRNTNYTLYQITNLNGGDLQYQTHLADGQITAALYAGQNRYQLPNNAAGLEDYFKLPLILGSFVAWENDQWLVRSSYTKIELQRRGDANLGLINVTVPALRTAAANGTCAVCADEAEKWQNTWDGVDYRVATVAARYSHNAMTLSGEFIRRTTDGTFPDTDGFNLEANYRWNDWTPYIDYLTARSRSNNRAVFNLPQFAALDRSYLAGKLDRNILTLGLKYDISRNLSARAESMRVRFDDPRAGTGFAPTQAGGLLPPSYRVTSLTLDLLF